MCLYAGVVICPSQETSRIGGILHSTRTAEQVVTVVRVGKEDEVRVEHVARALL